MRISVTTRADLFEERKRQHIERGHRIEDERPIRVNGLCSFVAVRETPGPDTFSELVALVLNGNRASRVIIEVFKCRSKFDFVSMADAAYTLGMTPNAMDGPNMEVAKVVNLCTSFIFTSGSQREGREKGRALSFELPPIQTNNPESTRPCSFQALEAEE